MSGSDKRGTWEDVFGEGVAPDVAEIAADLRKMIRAVDPDAVEVARPGEKSVCFGVGQRKNSEAYAYLMPQTDRVNLGFFQGTSLPDPDRVLEGTGAALRHVKVREAARAGDPGIVALVKAAVEERRGATGTGG